MNSTKRYWIVKGKPTNDFAKMLKPGRTGTWRTRKPPKSWQRGDVLCFWESSPRMRLVGLGELVEEQGQDEDDDTLFKVVYRSNLLDKPIGIDELRAYNDLRNASFLKPVQGTVFEVSAKQAARILGIIAKRNPREASLCTAMADVASSEPAKGYLLTWNPKKFKWADKQLDTFVDAYLLGRKLDFDWSCGRSKKLREGDRVFFARLGSKQRGIFASGVICRGSYEDKSDPEFGLKVEVVWDTFFDPRVDSFLLDPEKARGRALSHQTWTPQMSGIAIKAAVLSELEDLWARHSQLVTTSMGDPDQAGKEGLQKQRMILHRSRETRLRKAKLAEFKLNHGGQLFCEVCKFSFQDVYGIEYVEVHHRVPLADLDAPTKTTTADLAVLCANCHRVCHSNRKVKTLKQLQQMMRSTGKQRR